MLGLSFYILFAVLYCFNGEISDDMYHLMHR